jgi:hypothetical protein
MQGSQGPDLVVDPGARHRSLFASAGEFDRADDCLATNAMILMTSLGPSRRKALALRLITNTVPRSHNMRFKHD